MGTHPQGASNECPQHMFFVENKKKINTFWLKKTPYQELCKGMILKIIFCYFCPKMYLMDTQWSKFNEGIQVRNHKRCFGAKLKKLPVIVIKIDKTAWICFVLISKH